MVEPPTLPHGTNPLGASSEQDASRTVREMFTRIAPRYDFLNHLLSAQMDRVWRNRTARELKPILDRSDAIALDLCCGTGDLSFALRQRGKARPWHTSPILDCAQLMPQSGQWACRDCSFYGPLGNTLAIFGN